MGQKRKIFCLACAEAEQDRAGLFSKIAAKESITLYPCYEGDGNQDSTRSEEGWVAQILSVVPASCSSPGDHPLLEVTVKSTHEHGEIVAGTYTLFFDETMSLAVRLPEKMFKKRPSSASQ